MHGVYLKEIQERHRAAARLRVVAAKCPCAMCRYRFSSFPQFDRDGCKSRPSSLELRQEDRDLA